MFQKYKILSAKFYAAKLYDFIPVELGRLISCLKSNYKEVQFKGHLFE